VFCSFSMKEACLAPRIHDIHRGQILSNGNGLKIFHMLYFKQNSYADPSIFVMDWSLFEWVNPFKSSYLHNRVFRKRIYEYKRIH
jgi:hypothetical protein